MHKYTKTILTLLCAFTIGCASILPGNDPVVVHGEQTYQLAFDTFNTLFALDVTNRALELQYAPKVHSAINDLKPNAKLALANVHAAIEAYKYNRSADNKATLTTYLAVLNTELQLANSYAAQVNPLNTKTP